MLEEAGWPCFGCASRALECVAEEVSADAASWGLDVETVEATCHRRLGDGVSEDVGGRLRDMLEEALPCFECDWCGVSAEDPVEDLIADA